MFMHSIKLENILSFGSEARELELKPLNGGTCKTLLDQEPDPRRGTGLGAIGNDFWLERRFVPPSEEPDRGVGFCFGLVFGVQA